MTKALPIIEQLAALVNYAGILLEDAVEIVVPGADPVYWRRKLDNYDPAARPKRRRQPRRGGRSAASVLRGATYLAMAEQVARVNGDTGGE